METESHRVLQFRCAQTGKRFLVVFLCQKPSTRYRVVNVIDEKDIVEPEPYHPASDDPAMLPTGPVQKILGPLSTVIADAGRFVQRLVGSTALKKAPLSDDEQDDDPPYSQPPDTEDYDIQDFDFTGWYCPYCGHGKTPVRSQFIRCGRCHEYVCGSRIEQLPDGRTMFTCHDGCGNRGILSSGGLAAMTGLGMETQKPGRLDSQKGKLPSSRPALPSGKKDSD